MNYETGSGGYAMEWPYHSPAFRLARHRSKVQTNTPADLAKTGNEFECAHPRDETF